MGEHTIQDFTLEHRIAWHLAFNIAEENSVYTNTRATCVHSISARKSIYNRHMRVDLYILKAHTHTIVRTHARRDTQRPSLHTENRTIIFAFLQPNENIPSMEITEMPHRKQIHESLPCSTQRPKN